MFQRLLGACRRKRQPARTDPTRIAGLEALAEVSRRDDADQFAQLVAEAECAQLGHVPPSQPDSDDFVPWGLADPSPRCQRCKTRLRAGDGGDAQ
ncbi:MAG TPA: hypothetical protein VKZ89_09070 [Thermobifida alba]|nr:hypothetical protein [Thermobifida alba]